MEKRSKVKVAMVFGAYYGLSAIAVILLFYIFNFDPQSKLPSLFNYGLMILFLFLGIKSFRDEDNGGFISYGGSLGTGVLISIFGGALTSIFTVLLFRFIDPGLTERILESARQQLIESGKSEEQVELGIEMARSMMTPVWLFILGIAGSAFMGLFFSLFVSIFTRREQNPFQSNIG